MPLERLLTVPLQQLGDLFNESWSAFRGSSRYPDVPPLEASAGLIGEALLDRTFTLMTSVLTGVPLPDEVRQMVEEVHEARAFYGDRGWLDDPEAYHQPPPELHPESLERGASWAGATRQRYQHLRFESGYQPHPGEPGRDRWLAHPLNGTAHAYLLEHDEPRPWLVCIHGFAMGSPLLNFQAFPVQKLHHELGLNLAFPVLPLHGPRGTGRMGGSEVLSPDYLRMVHLFAQSVWDVRQLIGWLRQRGAEQVGLHGISLGGYVSSLVASLQDGLDAVIAGIPAVDFANLARDNEPWIMRRYDDQFELDWNLLRAITHVVSPLAFTPRLPLNKRFIYAGIADRVVKPDQPRALWRHWGHPEIHWFSGGHVMGSWNRSIEPFLESSLTQAGLVAPRD
jgi:hypothetical protein